MLANYRDTHMSYNKGDALSPVCQRIGASRYHHPYFENSIWYSQVDLHIYFVRLPSAHGSDTRTYKARPTLSTII